MQKYFIIISFPPRVRRESARIKKYKQNDTDSKTRIASNNLLALNKKQIENKQNPIKVTY
jgi:hypothetical protein